MKTTAFVNPEVFEKVKEVFGKIGLSKRSVDFDPAELSIDSVLTLFNGKVGNFDVHLRIKMQPEAELLLLGVSTDQSIPPRKLSVVRELLNVMNNRALIVTHAFIQIDSKIPFITGSVRNSGESLDEEELERVLSEMLDNARLFFPLISEQLSHKFNILG
jgi:hypothetical protein